MRGPPRQPLNLRSGHSSIGCDRPTHRFSSRNSSFHGLAEKIRRGGTATRSIIYESIQS